MGWIEARKRCEGRGAALLSLTSRRQTAGLVKLVRWEGGKPITRATARRSTRKKLSEFWTSGNDVEEEGVWEWAGTGGTPGRPRWSPDHPWCPVGGFGWSEEPVTSIEENCLVWVVEARRGDRCLRPLYTSGLLYGNAVEGSVGRVFHG